MGVGLAAQGVRPMIISFSNLEPYALSLEPILREHFIGDITKIKNKKLEKHETIRQPLSP